MCLSMSSFLNQGAIITSSVDTGGVKMFSFILCIGRLTFSPGDFSSVNFYGSACVSWFWGIAQRNYPYSGSPTVW